MKIIAQLKIFFQVTVLGCVALWPSVAMSMEEGQAIERLAEVNTHPAEKNSHQSRSQLFQGAVEELRKNPAAADIKECKTPAPKAGEICMHSARKV